MNPNFNGGCRGFAEFSRSEECERLGLQGKVWIIWIVVKVVKDWNCRENCEGLGLQEKNVKDLD